MDRPFGHILRRKEMESVKIREVLLGIMVVLGLVCIINMFSLNAKLNDEMAKTGRLNARIMEYQGQLSDAQNKYNEQVNIVNEQMNLIEDFKTSIEIAQRDADTLRKYNDELRARISDALSAVKDVSVLTHISSPVSQVTEISSSGE